MLKLLDKYKGMARVALSDGQSCHFYYDLWSDEILSQKFPELYSFAKKNITTVDGLAATPLHMLLTPGPTFGTPTSFQLREPTST